MIKIDFYETVPDNLLKFAVIVSIYKNHWVFCKHRERNTYECPGGHREPNENICDTAKRELWEETGAIKYELSPVCVYSVNNGQQQTFGMLYFADIFEFEQLPELEIEKVELFKELPAAWTYPDIQPKLINKIKEIFDI